MSRLREDEKRVLDLLGDAASAFRDLPTEHPADVEEFCLSIHACQNILLARVGLRAQRKQHGIDKRPIGFA